MRVKFWLRSALEFSLYVIGATLLYSGLMFLLEMERDWSERADMAMGYMVAMASVFELCMSGWNYKQHLPLALSFGSTRKEAFVGLQCYRLLFNGLVFGSAVILSLFSETSGLEIVGLLLAMLGVLLTVTAIGAFMGAVYVRFGGKGALISFAAIVVLIALVIVDIVMLVTRGALVLTPERPWPFICFPVVGAVLWGLSMIPEYRAVNRYTVKM